MEKIKKYLLENLVILPTNASYHADRDKNESLIDFAKHYTVKDAQDFYGNFYDSIEACVETHEYSDYEMQDIQKALANNDIKTLAEMIGWERVKTIKTLTLMYDTADIND